MESASGWDTLLTAVGVLMGMAAVMLILSLIVTGIVQFIQSVIGLRARNLRKGIELVLRSTLGMDQPEAVTQARRIMSIPAARRFDGRTEKSSHPAEAKESDRDTSRPPAALGRIGARVTWIEPDELPDRMRDVGLLIDEKTKTDVIRFFRRLEDYLRKSFLLHVRTVTVICSFFVAFVFQVSTTELVTNLTVNPQLREKYLTQAELTLDKGESLTGGVLSYESVSDQALDSLRQRHPELANDLEEASGKGRDRAEIVDELSLILSEKTSGAPETILSEYDSLLEQLYRAKMEQARKVVRESLEDLAMLDIGFWDKGWSYYADLENIIGVLLTGIFLTFGAPFWFDRLRELASLRDQLQGVKGGTAKK